MLYALYKRCFSITKNFKIFEILKLASFRLFSFASLQSGQPKASAAISQAATAGASASKPPRTCTAEQLKRTTARFFETLENVEDKGARLQILRLTLAKVKEARAGKTAYQFKCDECGNGWSSLTSKTGHACRVLDTHKSACYCWYAVKSSENDGKEELVVQPVKFGWGDCVLESLRCLSLVADYCVHSDERMQMRDKEYARKVDSAFDDSDLYLTLIEYGGLHDREVHSAEESLALTKHAEAVCIRDCKLRDLLTNLIHQPANIIDGHPNDYAYYEAVIRENHSTRNYLQFDRDQFNGVIDRLKGNPDKKLKGNGNFIGNLEAARNGDLRNIANVSNFLAKHSFANAKTNFEEIVCYLSQPQIRQEFKHMPTADWLYLYSERTPKAYLRGSRKGMHFLF